MRNRIRKQLRLVEPSIDHEHSKELVQIRKVLADHPEIGDLVYADLVRNLDDPEAGREGMMTAEQVHKRFIENGRRELSAALKHYAEQGAPDVR